MNKPFTLDKSGIAQSYHFGRFVQDAKRPTKIPFFTREIRPNTLWWSEFRSVNLQISRPFGFYQGSQLREILHHLKGHVGDLASDLSEIATLFGVRSSGKYKVSRYSRAFSSEISFCYLPTAFCSLFTLCAMPFALSSLGSVLSTRNSVLSALCALRSALSDLASAVSFLKNRCGLGDLARKTMQPSYLRL